MKKKLLLLGVVALGMTAQSQAQLAFPNSSMEEWRSIIVITSPTLSLNAPNNWYGIDSLVAAIAPFAGVAGISITPKKMLFKSTDSRDGVFAAEVQTKNLGDSVGNIGGVLSNAEIGINLAAALNGNVLDAITYSGGTNIVGMVSKVNAWVKTDPANADNSTILALAVKNSGDTGIIVAQGQVVIPSTTTSYTEVEVPLQLISSETSADRLIVLFTSSDMSDSSLTVNNSLLVDGVTYTMAATGITKPLSEATILTVYPNPATDVIQFELNKNEHPEDYQLTIVDIQGKIISTEILKSTLNTKNVSHFGTGTYFYTLTQTKNHKRETGKFVVK